MAGVGWWTSVGLDGATASPLAAAAGVRGSLLTGGTFSGIVSLGISSGAAVMGTSSLGLRDSVEPLLRRDLVSALLPSAAATSASSA